MRLFKSTIMSLAMLLVLCAPALAQDNPSASQYDAGDCDPEAGETCLQSVGGGVDSIVDNTEQGTDAVNDAMDDASGASASPGAVLSAETEASQKVSSSPGPTDAGPTGDKGRASITELPETGGSSPALPILGVLLAATGLLTCGIARR